MKDYLIIDNYFLNPKELKKWAFKQKFYTKENHPWKETLGRFPGFRTNYINNINEEKFKYLTDNLLKACEIFYEEKFQEFLSLCHKTESCFLTNHLQHEFFVKNYLCILNFQFFAQNLIK